MKLQRLRGRKICDRVLQKGQLWKGKHFQARFIFGFPRHPAVDPNTPGLFVGLVASSKLSKRAVERNRMRRRIREALREEIKAIQTFPAVQLLILPRSTSLKCPYNEIQADVLKMLQYLNR